MDSMNAAPPPSSSPSPSKSSSITSTKLEGHKAPVLCLDFDHSQGLLLSGSEDCTARLWDVRQRHHRACLCLPVQGEVLSVTFAPKLSKSNTSTSTNLDNNENVDFSPSSPFAKDHTIYLSMEHVVLEYDLRYAKSPIVSMPTRDWSPILQNQDEINQLAITYYTPKQQTSNNNSKSKSNNKKNHKTKTSSSSNSSSKTKAMSSSPQLYLAAADDAGTVRFVDTIHNSHNSSSDITFQSHILHHDPNGVAVVPTCAFRPMNNNNNNNNNHRSYLELASGGTDCKIHLWDLHKPKRPISSYTIQQPESGGETNKPQVCNPPMVHSLAWSPTGKLLAAGLGDGNIPIFSLENRHLVQTGYLPDGHGSSVASVLFPTFGCGKTNNNNNVNERLVLSGGSDGSVLCWDIGSNVMDISAGINIDKSMADPKQLFAPDFLGTSMDVDDNDNNSYLAKQTDQLLSLSLTDKAKILFGIPHNKKVNWMTTSENSIFVADTSNDITVYKLPLR